jgi:hypothetical protein
MTVIDKDYGYKAMMRAFTLAEGVTGWVGILSGRTRYPKSYRSWKKGPQGTPKFATTKKRKKRDARGGRQTTVAQVAGVLQAEGLWISQAIDGHMAVWDREWDAAARALIRGQNAADSMMEFCVKVRDTMRKELEKTYHMRSRRLWKTIGFRVGVPASIAKSGQQPRWQKILRQRGRV